VRLSIGEPQHATPQLIKDALTGALDGLAVYPTTAGSMRCASDRRLARAPLQPAAARSVTQVLPVNGSREALFSFAQTVIDAAGRTRRVLCPIRSIRSTKAQRCWPARSPPSRNDPETGFACGFERIRTKDWQATRS
jgi:N-succinyldiaminopimelate aminotransferase